MLGAIADEVGGVAAAVEVSRGVRMRAAAEIAPVVELIDAPGVISEMPCFGASWPEVEDFGNERTSGGRRGRRFDASAIASAHEAIEPVISATDRAAAGISAGERVSGTVVGPNGDVILSFRERWAVEI